MTNIYINGRFLMARQSGVQRVARRLVLELDALLSETPDTDNQYFIVCPDGETDLTLRAIAMMHLPSTGQWFEQVSLPRAAADGLLVNLANTGPLLHKNNIVMMHDAQVWTAPESYSRLFRLWYKTIQPLLGRRAQKILTVSEFSAGHLMQHEVVATSPTVIHNGVDHILDAPSDPQILDRLDLRPGSYVFAFASPQPHKNTKLLLEVAAMPNAPTLVLAGALPDGAAAPDNVTLAGKISDSELRALYERALCFALPSTTEGFGLPAGEAMVCGCPVLAANAGALPEVYAGAAMVLDPHTPAQWFAAIEALSGDPEKRRSLVDKGTRRGETLSWARAATRLHDAITETLAPL